MASSIVVGTNSWVTLDEATAYFGTRIGTATWDALGSAADREKYLITAYRWIRYDPAFNVTGSETIDAVKYGQCEAALFLANYSNEWGKRDALISSGVESFTMSKWTETLGEVKKPALVIDMFASCGLYQGGVGIIELSDPSYYT